MIICSACLLGVRCRYDDKCRAHPKILELISKEKLIPLCPEQLGGLPTPRAPAEIRKNIIITKSNADVTAQFQKGAKIVLELAKLFNVKRAILKQRSPSCGCGQIYDGTFTNTIIEGYGITAQLLLDNNIQVQTEEDFE